MRNLDQQDQNLREGVLEWLRLQVPKYNNHQVAQDDLLEMVEEWCDEHEQQVQRYYSSKRKYGHG